jgi:hypothetical protein
MITEDYVSFEIAKLLKEKGFAENCLMRYNKVGDLVEEAYKFNWNFQTIDYSAPTLQMAMKWLLKKYNIFICILFLEESNGFGYTIENIVKKEYITTSKNDGYSTYEETAEEAIKYCLENLI